MARARNKQQLLEFGDVEFTTLLNHIAELDDLTMTKEHVFDNRTVKDIIAHLYAWHQLLLTWYNEGMTDKKPQIPAPGYTFKETPELNEKLYQEYKDIELKDITKKLKASHNKLMKVIESHTDKELTTKKKYSWTGSTYMGSYMASATSSHYNWANSLIKKFRKRLSMA